MIPNELALVIFDYIEKITDKRSFSRTCKLYNDLTKEKVIQCAHSYLKHNSITENILIFGKDHLSRYTTELCVDGYFDNIPNHYYRKKNTLLCKRLILSNNVTLLQRAVDSGCTLYWDTCAEAAKYGYLDVIKFARENNCILTLDIAANAALYGHLHVLQWVKENYGISEETCINAIKGKHLDIIKWLMDERYLYFDKITRYAIFYVCFDILKWSVENEVMISYRNYYFGMKCENHEIVMWLKEKYDAIYNEEYENDDMEYVD
jgi:hypothetical protein